ncbi:MAG: glycosyltransferase, partial [Bacteroidia bacterium]
MTRSEQHILFIGLVWPEPASSAGGSRTMQLIDLFQSQGWKITFASAATDSEYMFDIKRSGVEKVSIELNNESFDAFIKKINPSIVVFDKFMVEEQFGWRVAENCPGALRILDTIDLHCLRIARQQALKEKRIFTGSDLFSDIAKREIASILRCDI